jgi:hypothetical protein
VNIQYLPPKPICTDCLLLKGKFITLTLAVFGKPIDLAALKAEQVTTIQNDMRLQVAHQKVSEQPIEPDTQEPIEPFQVQVKLEVFSPKKPEQTAQFDQTSTVQDFKVLLKDVMEETEDDKEIKSIDLDVKSIENGRTCIDDGKATTIESPVKMASNLNELNNSVSPVASSIGAYSNNLIITEPVPQNDISSPVSEGPLSNVHSPDQSGDENADDEEEGAPALNLCFKQASELKQLNNSLTEIETKKSKIFDESMDLEAISPEQLPIVESTETPMDEDVPSESDVCRSTKRTGKEHTFERPNKKDALETISSSEEEYFEEAAEDMIQGTSDQIFLNQEDELEDISFFSTFEPDTDHELEELESEADNKQNSKSKQIHLLHNIHLHDQKALFDERWIEFVEQLSKDLFQLNLDEVSIRDTLTRWTTIGLNFEKAIEQRQTAYKVRHLKAGIRLTISLTKQSELITSSLLANDCLTLILELFDKPHMTLPVKLLLIRALDAFADRSSAAAFMIRCEDSAKLSVYQRLVELMSGCSQTRLSVAIAVLINKLHLFETIASFDHLFQSEPENVCLVFAEIRNILKQNSVAISQRLRYLPSSNLFSLSPTFNNSFRSIFTWFEHFDTLSLILDTIENSTNLPLFFELTLFIRDVIEHEHGISYLLNHKQIKHTNQLRKCLRSKQFRQRCLQHLESGVQIAAPFDFDTLSDRLTYRACVLFLLQKIDKIQNEPESSVNALDDPLLCDCYNRLFSLLFSFEGCKAIVFCFCLTNRLNILLKLLVQSVEQNSLYATLNKSAVFHYAGKLLLFTLSRADEQLPLLYERFEQPLLALSSHARLTPLNGLSRWTVPLKKGFTHSQLDRNLRILIQILKEHYERAVQTTTQTFYQLQPDLVASIHLLRHLCIEPDSSSVAQSSHVLVNGSPQEFTGTSELKYQYALIETFSQNGFAYILSICKRLTETLLKPAPRYSLLHSKFGRSLLSLLLPCTQIIRQTLIHLVTCRSNQFQDTSPLPTLLMIYCTVLHVPKTSHDYERSNQIAECVIDCLRVYTQIDQSSADIEDQAFAKSVWTKMSQELITFTLSKPQFLAAGLDLFSQLLPLPLPISCAHADQNESVRMINFRKLWSAHLHSISSSIEQLISHLATSSSPVIRALTTRISVQLSDLSSHTALAVARCLLSLLKVYFSPPTNSSNYHTSPDDCDDLKKPSEDVKNGSNPIGHRLSFFVRLPDRSLIGRESQLRLINFIVGLLRHEPFAMAFQVAFKTRPIRKESADKNGEEWTGSLLKFIKEAPQNAAPLVRIVENRGDGDESIVIGSEQMSCVTADHLNAYFNARTVQIGRDSDGSTGFKSLGLNQPNLSWFELEAQLILTESVADDQLSAFDLSDLADSCLPTDYDFKERMRQLWSEDGSQVNDPGDQSPPPPSLRASQKRPYAPLITRENASKQPYVAPMRGRGFQRNALMSGRTNDPFRSRPPNTSRPPSMHVDDFVALEQQNNKRSLPGKDYGKYSNSKLSGNGNAPSSMMMNSVGGNNNSNNNGGMNSANSNNHGRFSSMSNRMYPNRHSYNTYNSYSRNMSHNGPPSSGLQSNNGGMSYMSQSNDQQQSSMVGGRSYQRYGSNSMHYSNNLNNSGVNYRNNSIGSNWTSNSSNAMNSSLSSNRLDNRNNRNHFNR